MDTQEDIGEMWIYTQGDIGDAWRCMDIWISTLKEMFGDMWISTYQDIRRHPEVTGAVIPNQDGARVSLGQALVLKTTPPQSVPEATLIIQQVQ